jgi:hypothetical protein
MVHLHKTTSMLQKNNSNLAEQNNSANIYNDVTSNANSGYNAADFSTGGSALISTGPTWNNTALVNRANSNVLSGFSNCNCGSDLTFVKEGLNGAESTNNITANSSNDNSLFGTNYATANNTVNSQGQSGYNSASYATGNGFGFSDPTVLAGATYTNTNVDTAVNQNDAGSTGFQIGGMSVNFTMTNPFSWMMQ